MPQTAFEGRPQITAERVIDLRADGAIRTVHVTASGVTIERSIEGVRMRVGVPIAAYRGLVLAVREASETATLTLRHADQDLDVALGSGDALDVARAAKGWADLLGQPIEIQVASVAILASQPRRQGRTPSRRRSRFARRRKTGIAGLAARSFATEHEIIARR